MENQLELIRMRKPAPKQTRKWRLFNERVQALKNSLTLGNREKKITFMQWPICVEVWETYPKILKLIKTLIWNWIFWCHIIKTVWYFGLIIEFDEVATLYKILVLKFWYKWDWFFILVQMGLIFHFGTNGTDFLFWYKWDWFFYFGTNANLFAFWYSSIPTKLALITNSCEYTGYLLNKNYRSFEFFSLLSTV